MSCIFCIEYEGLNKVCKQGTIVKNLSESFSCEYYEYNGELNDNKSD